ncbi:uncharacterized protein BDR25DRAFT_348578 [Lindgomyces ingoldianus]|uniref:Uncharacterized protein n=1 Tax=Lindgomyces ingoldianus TaxID=673940 RepID=A0ACB6RGR7_9PLEO|nr:uncharacterized protein BDR25DRAFT_348578 [Lindgomyces ingoldianus]KAF2478322.1 hypothetical protein BDR25DRAFT_348578 [Lindgomyces ingoldianus]
MQKRWFWMRMVAGGNERSSVSNSPISQGCVTTTKCLLANIASNTIIKSSYFSTLCSECDFRLTVSNTTTPRFPPRGKSYGTHDRALQPSMEWLNSSGIDIFVLEDLARAVLVLAARILIYRYPLQQEGLKIVKQRRLLPFIFRSTVNLRIWSLRQASPESAPSTPYDRLVIWESSEEFRHSLSADLLSPYNFGVPGLVAVSRNHLDKAHTKNLVPMIFILFTPWF